MCAKETNKQKHFYFYHKLPYSISLTPVHYAALLITLV